jgi:hypothetical protein
VRVENIGVLVSRETLQEYKHMYCSMTVRMKITLRSKRGEFTLLWPGDDRPGPRFRERSLRIVACTSHRKTDQELRVGGTFMIPLVVGMLPECNLLDGKTNLRRIRGFLPQAQLKSLEFSFPL